MKNNYILIILLQFVIGITHAELVHVVATTTDMKSITEMIGGNRVTVTSIATGYQNPHFVDPKPSYIISLSNADMFITVGLDLEAGWSSQLLVSSRNAKIQKGAPGYVDASESVNLLQVPESANRGAGDIHIYGNPHYWLDPLNGKIIARNIANGLERVDPAGKNLYESNLKVFNEKLDAKAKEWIMMMAPYKGSQIIAYHNEWVYFEKRFGLKVMDFMEPKPGIPPTPSQLVKIINEIRTNKIKAIVSSPYFNTSSSDVVSRQTGAKTVVLATSVGAFDGIKNYFDLFDYDLKHLIAALQ